ncbi:YTH domain protein [Metarhizium robertsii ARSEF 23]|uniref:YTH domain protein n=2 Tax=Metarhizium robertsii TaxID=568076 RepID=A0A0B2XGF0_METRA|nr:YTH domain protein [Metarhizium robertsii ARSEF 23]KHO11775.1 YTH domain protein [Metarhizium robertsii ARSEF 23]
MRLIMMGMIPAYATLFAAAAAAAASSNGTMFAAAPGLWNDPCALGCLAGNTCPGRDKNCLCDNVDLVTSDASRGCLRDGCPNVKADDVVGQLRGECSGKKTKTAKGSPVVSMQESTSGAAAGSSPTVNGVNSVGGSSLVPSSPSPPSPSATEGTSSTASAGSPVAPTAASPGPWTGVPTVILNTYTASSLLSQISGLVVATSTPHTSTASTTGGGVVVAAGSGSNGGRSTTPPSPKGTTSSTSDQDTDSHDSQLSAGAKAGIGISIAVLCLGIISAVFFFAWRRRRGQRNSGLREDTISWLGHAGEKHRTLQAIPAFGPTRKIGGGGGDGFGSGGLAMSLEPSSHLTYLSLGSEPSPRDEMGGIGMALSSDTHDLLDSRTLVAEGDSETPLRDGDLDSPVIPRFVVPHGYSLA